MLYVNPGPAGRTLTFNGRSVALLRIEGGKPGAGSSISTSIRGGSLLPQQRRQRSKPLLDRLDAEAEAFNQELTREYYLNGTGLKEELSIVPIFERYAHLFTRQTVDDVNAAPHDDERWAPLRAFVVEGYLENAAKSLSEQIAARETGDAAKWRGQEGPFSRAAGPHRQRGRRRASPEDRPPSDRAHGGAEPASRATLGRPTRRGTRARLRRITRRCARTSARWTSTIWRHRWSRSSGRARRPTGRRWDATWARWV